MELQFQKQNGIYVATATVEDDYNLHVECNKPSDVIVNQRTSGEKYAVVHYYKKETIVDDDFDGIVYPKSIMVTSTEPVSVAAITPKQ